MCDPWTDPPLERTDRRPATVHEPFSATENPLQNRQSCAAEPDVHTTDTAELASMKILNVFK